MEKLGTLRGKVLTDEQFHAQRAKLLADPAIGSYLESADADPLDRLKTVAQLQEQGVVTADQALGLTDKILNDN